MIVTIDIQETMLDSYCKVYDFLMEHPTRKDWEGVLRNYESEIAQLVRNSTQQQSGKNAKNNKV